MPTNISEITTYEAALTYQEIYSLLKTEFNEEYYARTYPELVTTEPDLLEHFIKYGWKEGRNPTPDFDTKFYLTTYKDVQDSQLNPFYHYIKWGRSENRACNEKMQVKLIYSELKGRFDEQYYASTYPELVTTEPDLLEHFIKYGWKEGRNPTPDFDTKFYMETWDDVLINPFYHYIKWGMSENRITREPAYKQIEAQLLLCCIRTKLDLHIKEQIINYCKDDIDWIFLKKIAKKNGVITLLYKSINETCPEIVPEQIFKTLSDEVHGMLDSNQKNLILLLNILDLLESNQIYAIPFKGIALTFTVYGSLDLRDCGTDIDILVQRKDFIKAKDLLIRNGYIHGYFGNAEVATLQAQLGRDDRQTGVDLHYGLTPYYHDIDIIPCTNGSRLDASEWNRPDRKTTYWYYSLDTQPLWDRVRYLIIANKSIRIFSPEDNLLILSTHCIKEYWGTLRRICDIAESINSRPDLNWNWILEQVTYLRCKRKFLLGLRIAYDIFKIPLPDKILEMLNSAFIGYLSKLKCRNLCIENYTPTMIFEMDILTSAFTADNFKDRILFFCYIFRKYNPRNNPMVTISNLFHVSYILIKHNLLLTADWSAYKIR